LPREPSADRAQRCGERAADFLSQARARRWLREYDLARRLRVNQRETRPVERERVVRCEEVILVVPVLGDPERSSNALDPRSPGVVYTDKLTSFEVELGAIKPDVHGHLLSLSQRSARAARVEIPCRKKPNDSTPEGEKQDAQGDPVRRCSALLHKLDVHGPSFHNAVSACFSALGRQGSLRLIPQ